MWPWFERAPTLLKFPGNIWDCEKTNTSKYIFIYQYIIIPVNSLVLCQDTHKRLAPHANKLKKLPPKAARIEARQNHHV